MKSKLIIAASFLVLTLTSCANKQKQEDNAGQKQSNTDSNMASATPALPSYSLQDVNGNTVDIKSFKGKKVFVNLWATWCPPCKREMPSIEKLYHSVDTNKVKFVLISLDDKFETAKRFVSAKELDLPIYFPLQNPPALFDVMAIPATFIFNENGELIKRIDGSDNYDTKEYKDLLQ